MAVSRKQLTTWSQALQLPVGRAGAVIPIVGKGCLMNTFWTEDTEEGGDTVYCPGLTTFGGCSVLSFKYFTTETLKTSCPEEALPGSGSVFNSKRSQGPGSGSSVPTSWPSSPRPTMDLTTLLAEREQDSERPPALGGSRCLAGKANRSPPWALLPGWGALGCDGLHRPGSGQKAGHCGHGIGGFWS